MNKSFIKNKYSIKKINIITILSLIPLILIGTYKNGIKLYNESLINFYEIFKPLFFVFIGFSIGIIINLFNFKKEKTKTNLINKIFSSSLPLYGIIIASIISINTNIILFGSIILIIFLLSFFIEKYINVPALICFLIIVISKLTTSFTYLNPYEINKTFNLVPLDYFLGRGSGGIATTHIFILIISLLFLSYQKYYKKNIAFSSIITFITIFLSYGIYKNDISFALESIFSNSILFAFIYIAPNLKTSSYTKKGTLIFGMLIGFLTFIFSFFNIEMSVFISILIVSLFHKYIDKYSRKWLK